MAMVKMRITSKEARFRAERARTYIAKAERATGKRARANIARAKIFTPKLKRQRADGFGNFSKSQSLQHNEGEDDSSLLDRNLRPDKERGDKVWGRRDRDGRPWGESARVDIHLSTPKLKMPKVDVIGNIPKCHGSMQGNEREDCKYSLKRDLVKSSELQLVKINDEISQFSVQPVGVVNAAPAPGESFPSPCMLKDNSVKSKEDQNTSRQGLMKRQHFSDHDHSDMIVTCEGFDVSQQHVSCLEVKVHGEVKNDLELEVLEDTSANSTKQNWSNEHPHKTNIVSSNVAATSSSSNHIRTTPKHTDRLRVEGTIEAYKEILAKLPTKWKAQQRYVQAAMVLKEQGKWVNTTKHIGSTAGVKVGDKFRYRALLKIIGLHMQFNDGIDCVRRTGGKVLAISIVDSGRYANNLQSPDILIYSGQGGKPVFDSSKPRDQIMQGGNLALKNSQEEGTPIRVIRKLKLRQGSIYVYYGLYIVEGVMEERELGMMTYKFRLRRMLGQPELSFDT